MITHKLFPLFFQIFVFIFILSIFLIFKFFIFNILILKFFIFKLPAHKILLSHLLLQITICWIIKLPSLTVKSGTMAGTIPGGFCSIP